MAISVSSLLSAASGGAGNLGTLYVKLVADASGVDQGMQDAENAIVGGATSISKAAMLAAAAVVGLATAAVTEFAKFESSFANVRKTVQATSEEFKQFETVFRRMATELPTNVNEINNIAAAAGQLGIEKDAIVGFTKVMIDLGNTTNIHGVEAAQNLARLANITQMSQKDFDRLGSTLSDLDRKTAATASEILTLALRIGGISHNIGMSNPDILAFSASLASVGVTAEAGGTAISTTMVDIAKAVAVGNTQLQEFAKVAGMAATDFQTLFKTNATEAIIRFVEGLKMIQDAGGDAVITLNNLGLDGARVTRTLLSAAEAGDLFRKINEQSNTAWKENTALVDMANERYKTLISQLTVTWNRLKDMFITIGENLAPAIKDLNKTLQDALDTQGEWAGNINDFAKKIGPGIVLAIDLIKEAVLGLRIAYKLSQLAFLEMSEFVQVGITKTASFFADNINIMIKAWNKFHPVGAQTPLVVFGDAAKADLEANKQLITDTKLEIDKLGFSAGVTALQIQKKWNDINKPVEHLNTQVKTLGDNFEMGDFLKGLDVKGKAAASSLDAVTLATRKMKAELLANSQKVDTVLDKVGAPKPTDLFGAQRGMSKAELQLGAMSGISGGDAASQTQLQIQTEIELNQRKVAELAKLGNQEGQLTEETQRRKLDAIKMYNQQAKNLQAAQQAQMMASFTSIGDSMLQIGTVFFGKQTAMYKAMFAASKAFAIAESVVKIEQGIASAAALPWPANLAAIASVVAATANIVSTISAVKLEFAGAKAMGGPVTAGAAFLVGEKGPEMFVPASMGTIVPNDKMGGGNVQVNVHNYTDTKVDVQQRQEGDEKFLDIIIKRATTEVASQIRDGRGDVNKALSSTFQLRRAQQ